MQEFMESIQAPVNEQFSVAYLALTAADRTQAIDNEGQVVIDALAKRCYLMGVNQAIKVTLT